MKISDTLEQRLKNTLESENERALRRMMRDKQSILIPMHTANMRMLDTDEQGSETSIRRTIIPEVLITINPTAVQDGMISRHGLYYTLAQNKQAFPIAHVYSGGGSLCLGGIFVPAFIPKYSPQQPLETLFLHNDRHVSHGNPQLPVSDEQRQAIVEIVYTLNKVFPIDVHHNDWVKKDTLWRIGEYMLNHYPKEQAFKIMSDIFIILFES